MNIVLISHFKYNIKNDRSYTKIYRACFLAPMLGPHHFAALLEGGGGGRGGMGGDAGALLGGVEIRNWISAPLYEMPAPRFVSVFISKY